MNPGIFGFMNRCCGSLDLENAGSWCNSMMVLCRYYYCMTVMTSGLQFMFSWVKSVGSVSNFFIFQVPDSITVSLFLLFVPLSCGVGTVVFVLCCFCGPLARPARSVAGLLHPPIHCLCSVGPTSLNSPLQFIHTGHPGLFAAWLPLHLIHLRLLCGYSVSFPHSLHLCLGCSAKCAQWMHFGLWLWLHVGCVSSWQLRHLFILLVSI